MAARHRGPYFDVPLSCWPHILEEFEKPWLEESAIADLLYWSAMADSKKGKRPDKSGLAERWGWDEKTVRSLLTSITYPKSHDQAGPPLEAKHWAVFNAWGFLQNERTKRKNKFTSKRQSVVRSALRDYSPEDLILVIRMAFEYPYEDFLVNHWRSGDFMDIVNLINGEKVDRNVTRARERWDGKQWLQPKAVVTSEEGSTGDKAWQFIIRMVRSKPERPKTLHADPRSNAALNMALDAVGGWGAIEDVRPGFEMNKLSEIFKDVVMSTYHSWEPPKIPYLAVVDGEKT